MDALKGLMMDFVETQLATDERVRYRFTRTDPHQFEELLAIQLCELTGGPCHYTGRGMKEAHAGLAITAADFTAFVEDLQKSLVKFKVADTEQRELLGVVGKLREQIVE